MASDNPELTIPELQAKRRQLEDDLADALRPIVARFGMETGLLIGNIKPNLVDFTSHDDVPGRRLHVSRVDVEIEFPR